MQCVTPVLGVYDTCRVVHIDRALDHRAAFVFTAHTLTIDTFLAENAGEYIHKTLWKDRAARHLLACEDGDILYRTPLLEKSRAACDIVNERT